MLSPEPEVVAAVRQLRYMDGLSCRVVGERFGVATRTINEWAPGRPGKVPNDKVRALFEASPMSAGDVARAVGWWKMCGPPRRRHFVDGVRVLRTLGLAPEVSRGRQTLRSMIDAETAGDLAEAMGFGRWEALPDDRHA